jgi:hypothetical protein
VTWVLVWPVLKRLWPVLALFLVGLSLAAWGHSRYAAGEAAGRAQVQSAWDARVRAQEDEAARLKAKADETVKGYEDEIQKLRDRPVPTRVVRLCRPANPGNVPDARAARAADGAGAGTGVVSESAGPDIGADLYGLAKEADEIAARLRALQDWNRSLSGSR